MSSEAASESKKEGKTWPNGPESTLFSGLLVAFYKYYWLLKPGITRSNVLAAAAGFLFASTTINWWLFVATMFGIACVIASGCVFNNYMDRALDAKMERTQKRALVRGIISNRAALIYASMLGVVGALTLFLYTNTLTLMVALVGWVVYVLVYTPLKPRNPIALFVGGVAGSIPLVVGYVAATNTLDWYAFILFAVLYVWQIVHFMAIAVYRYDEYTAAGVPLYIRKRPSDAAKQRARKVFYASLFVLLFFCLFLILQRWIR